MSMQLTCRLKCFLRSFVIVVRITTNRNRPQSSTQVVLHVTNYCENNLD